jgi:hypothetical protein
MLWQFKMHVSTTQVDGNPSTAIEQTSLDFGGRFPDSCSNLLHLSLCAVVMATIARPDRLQKSTSPGTRHHQIECTKRETPTLCSSSTWISVPMQQFACLHNMRRYECPWLWWPTKNLARVSTITWYKSFYKALLYELRVKTLTGLRV